MGIRVIAVDGGADKKKLCIDDLGAEEYAYSIENGRTCADWLQVY